ncbi:MAG: hypothetical protein ACKVP7_07850 [Hyphomicrobiaceae bacterium]
MNDISDAERIKRINRLRFNWHEQVSSDPFVRRYPTAMALANHFQHRFRSDRGYAEFSIKSAAKALKMPSRSVSRAKKVLEQRGWIRLIEPWKPGRAGWSANRYIFLGGPDDLVLEEHKPQNDDDTDSDDRA